MLLCLSSPLDFFPLPVWEVEIFRGNPGSPSWLWSGAATKSPQDRRETFRLEEAGDDYFLVSYASPEGWRCAVEVHRFLVG